ncbi:MFS family permease [Psychromicrobium silvestre]|uniref:Multidrug efflux pump Tap n=1 Tax=Psychromicrobium silvestre TaxID=1645614 RepID=A0A7Y9LRA3_9MICC|nr:MFS transporter [Psychromicrobium silvestre]NYE94150.1 MFS family permease [Psychromicrobium silvestre]
MSKCVERGRARRSIVGLLAAHAISQTGNAVTLLAVPFYVLATGGSGSEVGLAAAFATIPVVIGGPLGGVLVDRIGYRKSSILADLVSGLTVLAIPVLALTIGLPFWALLALVFLGGLLDTPGQTARRVMLPAVSTLAQIRLERSVGFLDGVERLASMLGASVAGLLIGALGPANALFLDAASFGLSALIMASLVSKEPGAASGNASDAVRKTKGYWAELLEGFRFVRKQRLLLAIVVMVLLTNLFDAARTSSLMPLYANSRLGGAAALGSLLAIFGAGALLGTIGFGMIAHRMPRRMTFALCFILAGPPAILAFAVGLPFGWLLFICALSGLASGALNPILGALQLELVPEGMRARVFGLSRAGAWLGIPLGALLGGLAADRLGLNQSFAIIAALYLLVTLAPLVVPVFKQMDRTPAPPSARFRA